MEEEKCNERDTAGMSDNDASKLENNEKMPLKNATDHSTILVPEGNSKESLNDCIINSSVTEVTRRLNQELSLSAIHRRTVESRWIQILRKGKFEELHAEIPTLQKYHSENVHRKKDVINSIEREIINLEELYHEAMVSNILRMEEMINFYDDQVILLERDFRDRIDVFQNDFKEYEKDLKYQYGCDEEYIRQSVLRQEHKENYQSELMKQEQQHELEEIKNRNLEGINSLRFQLDSKVEDLEEQFEQAHCDFAQNTDFTKAAYDQLKTKDDRMKKEIKRKTRKADKLYSDMQKYVLIAKQEEVQIKEQRMELLQRKARAIQRFQMTKDEMASFRKEQQKKLVELSRVANERKDELRKQCDLAERVKKIALGCRKWETDREEFASLLRDSSQKEHSGGDVCQNDEKIEINLEQQALLLVEEERRAAESSLIKESAEPMKAGSNNQRVLLWNTTHKFWDKYNMAQLDVLTLEKQLDGLKQREQDLHDKLKRYHDGITVNDDVLKDRNPLLVINGKMNFVPENNLKTGVGSAGNGRKTRRLTVVDGNHIFATHFIR